MLLHRAAAGWLEDALRGCWEPGELGSRSTRANDELTAAIWTLPAKHLTCARLAERALERTDACFSRFRRQIAVAAFAVWTEFEHG